MISKLTTKVKIIHVYVMLFSEKIFFYALTHINCGRKWKIKIQCNGNHRREYETEYIKQRISNSDLIEYTLYPWIIWVLVECMFFDDNAKEEIIRLCCVQILQM